MRIKDSIKIREEDCFFLLVNLDSSSILKGYPSFFKINKMGNEIILLLKESNLTKKDIIDQIMNNKSYKCSESSITDFLSFLERYDLCYE